MKGLMNRPVLYVLLAGGLILAGVFAGSAALAQRQEPAGAERAEGSEYVTTHIEDFAPEQLPELQAAGTVPLYHFAGVLNDAGVTGTAVQCTNVDAAASTLIEVQLFQYDASFVDTATINVGPLRTVTFESTSIAFYIADAAMSAATVEQGYGRILTEHSNVICTVQVMDSANSPPTWSMDIPLYRQGYSNVLPAILRNATP
jgi:hypothetical protein